MDDTEKAFPRAHESRGLLLWAYVGNEIGDLLRGLTKLSSDEIKKAVLDWESAANYKRLLPNLTPYAGPIRSPEGPAKAYCDEFRKLPFFENLAKQIPTAEFAYIPADSIVSALVLIDFDYVAELDKQLEGQDSLSIVKFAFPESVAAQAKIAVDTAGMTVTIQSSQKTMVVADMRVGEIPGVGVEIRYMVTNLAAVILVSEVEGRFYLRSGIHRAFLLTKLAQREIPCILVRESRVPVLAGPYPAFTLNVLVQPRPPLLADFLDNRLALEVPLSRMSKIIRISASDFLVPSD